MNARQASNHRSGYSLLELLASLGSATILLGGLATCLAVSRTALNPSGVAQTRVDIAAAHAQLSRDLAHATAFTERTATATTFMVPDRDGDGVPETLRYAWSGTPGDPLTWSVNGSGPHPLLASVDEFDLGYAIRLIPGVSLVNDATSTKILFVEFTEAAVRAGASTLTVSRPTEVETGDLLIGVIAVAADVADSVTGPPGWTFLHRDHEVEGITLGLWYRVAEEGEPADYTFSGINNAASFAYVLTFRGTDPDFPVATAAYDKGNDDQPEAPSVTAGFSNGMVVRIAAFEKDHIEPGKPGVADHTAILMSTGSGQSECSSGAAYRLQEQAGDSGTANFELTQKAKYRTATLLLRPAP